MSTDDRFLPQGKQILPKICQVRPMPYFELKTKNTDTGNDTKTLIPGKPTKQERGSQTPYQNVKQKKNSFSNVGKIALERFVIATLYSSTLHCQTS